MDINNSVALITGGASGIGQACAKHLASLGARIAIVDRDKERGKASYQR